MANGSNGNSGGSSTPIIVGVVILIVIVAAYFLMQDNRKDGDDCDPTDDEKVDNADDYVIEVDEDDDTKTCVPDTCVSGYNLSDGQCEADVDVVEEVEEVDVVETQPGAGATVPAGGDPNPSPPPPPPPPTNACKLTELPYTDGVTGGAICEGSPYRKTQDWCCSEYGLSKGYKWKAV